VNTFPFGLCAKKFDDAAREFVGVRGLTGGRRVAREVEQLRDAAVQAVGFADDEIEIARVLRRELFVFTHHLCD
jgi:hypothetical protein